MFLVFNPKNKMSKLILINNLVRKKEIFEQSCSEDTSYLVVEASLDYKTFGTLTPTGLTHLCLLFDNTGKKAPYFIYDDEELVQYQAYLDSLISLTQNDIETLELSVPKFLTSTTSFLSPSFMTFIKNYKLNNPSLEYLDLITCNVSEEMIKDQAEELLSIGITVRYSTNFTGKDGDWILESHNVNVTDIYFRTERGTETSSELSVLTSLKDYPYQLGIGDEPPLLITTEEHLYNLMISTDVTSGGVLTRNYTLGNDIDMTKLDQNLYPAQSIGKSGINFSGSFNGNNYTITIGNVNSTYNGLFGFVISSNSNTIQNVNLVYKNSISISTNNNYIGGFIGFMENFILTNCNVRFENNVTIDGFYSGGFCGGNLGTINNCNFVILGTTSINGNQIGGFIGTNFGSTNNCVAIFGPTTTISSTQTSNRIGGLCGNIGKNSVIYNSHCIFGDTTIISGSTSGGIIGYNNGSLEYCSCFFYNYKIYGTTIFNTIRGFAGKDGSLTLNNIHTFNIKYDNLGNLIQSSIDTEGITIITSTIDTIFTNINNAFSETQWIIPLIRLRQKLDSSNTVITNASIIKTNNKTHFSQLLGTNAYSTNVPTFIKHTAIKLSLSYSNQNNISTDFLNVKNLLTEKNNLQDTLEVEYLSTPSNNIFITEKGKIYYTTETTGTLTSNNVSTTFDVSLGVGSNDPKGVYFDTTNFRKIGQVYSKNGIDFTVYGIGSGLFGISETGSKLYIGEIDLKNPTSGYDIITNTLTGLYYNTYKVAPLYTGNLLHVDAVYGDDTAATATSESKYHIPFKTIQAALNVAVSGQTVLVYPGTYNEAITMTTSNVSLRGVSVQTVKIQQVDVTSTTTLVTLGQNCRIEDVTLTLSSSSNSNINLIGVDIQSDASITSKLRTLVLNVNYTGTGTGNIYGIYSGGTSSVDPTSSNTIRASTINVTSTANGVCRGILVSNTNLVSSRDTNIYASGTGTDIIGCETASVNSHLDLITSSVSGVLQDIKQTNGHILISSTNLVNNNAGTQSFSVSTAVETLYFGVLGNLGADKTYYLVPGVIPETTLDNLTSNFNFGFIQSINLFNVNMKFSGTLTSGVTLTLSIYKNNEPSPTITLTANSSTIFPVKEETVSIYLTTSDTIYATLTTVGNPPNGTFLVQCELY